MSLEELKEKYGYEIGDIWMPRVTAITSIVSKPNISRFYAEYPSLSAATEGLMNSVDWGILTHSTIERILKGENFQIDEKIAPSIQAFQKWQKENAVKLQDPERDIERRVFDREHLYAGTIDVIAEVRGDIGIIDIKTGNGIWEEYSLQTAAYLNAYNKSRENLLPFSQNDGRCEKRWILRIDQYQECIGCLAKRRTKAGKPRIKGGKLFCNHQWGPVKGEVEFKELKNYEDDLDAFLAAKEVWEWYNKKWLKKIPNYPKNF